MFLTPLSAKRPSSRNDTRKLSAEPLEDRSVPATINGYAFQDLNRDGVQDSGEGVFVGVGVGLTGSSSGPYSTETDQNGYYEFAGLPAPDEYDLTVVPPAGYDVTTPPGGTEPINIDNDTDAVGVGIGLATSSGSGSGLPVISMTAVNVQGGSSGEVIFTRTGGDLSQPLAVGYDVSGDATPGNPGDPRDRLSNPGRVGHVRPRLGHGHCHHHRVHRRRVRPGRAGRAHHLPDLPVHAGG